MCIRDRKRRTEELPIGPGHFECTGTIIYDRTWSIPVVTGKSTIPRSLRSYPVTPLNISVWPKAFPLSPMLPTLFPLAQRSLGPTSMKAIMSLTCSSIMIPISDPIIHSTDSAGINQVNFAILDMFGYRFAPRYKDISSKSKTIYSFRHPGKYADCPLRPKRQILTGLIMDEWDNFQRITASLAMKTTTQSTIIKKLSSHKRNDRTIRAIAEYNNIVETHHKLHFIDDPDFQKQVQTVLNRGEHVNKLRKHLFHANGGKFKVHTVMEQKIWSECNRLLTNAIIYYNTWLLTELLDFHEQKGNIIDADLIKKVSPIAWQHIHIHGRYTFKIDKVDPDILSIIKNVKI